MIKSAIEPTIAPVSARTRFEGDGDLFMKGGTSYSVTQRDPSLCLRSEPFPQYIVTNLNTNTEETVSGSLEILYELYGYPTVLSDVFRK